MIKKDAHNVPAHTHCVTLFDVTFGTAHSRGTWAYLKACEAQVGTAGPGSHNVCRNVDVSEHGNDGEKVKEALLEEAIDVLCVAFLARDCFEAQLTQPVEELHVSVDEPDGREQHIDLK